MLSPPAISLPGQTSFSLLFHLKSIALALQQYKIYWYRCEGSENNALLYLCLVATECCLASQLGLLSLLFSSRPLHPFCGILVDSGKMVSISESFFPRAPALHRGGTAGVVTTLHIFWSCSPIRKPTKLMCISSWVAVICRNCHVSINRNWCWFLFICGALNHYYSN